MKEEEGKPQRGILHARWLSTAALSIILLIETGFINTSSQISRICFFLFDIACTELLYY